MLTAVQEIEKSDIERAVSSEKAALACLIRARETIRQILSRSRSSLASASRDFSRRQYQRLRPPPEEKSERKGIEDLLERLRSLRDREEIIYATISRPSAQLEDVEAEQRGVVEGAIEAKGRMEGTVPSSDLARRRMDEAIRKADSALGAIGRGNREQAAEEAKDAAGLLRELVRQIEGLAEESAQRLAIARDRASELARCERCLGGEPGGSPTPPRSDARATEQGRGTGAGVAESSADLSRGAETLEDLLRSLAREGAGGDSADAGRVRRLIEETNLPSVVQRLREQEERAAAGDFDPSSSDIKDLAERLDVLAQRLDALYRSIVTPRLQDLLALEKRATGLLDRLGKLSSSVEISEWHRQADRLVQDVQREAPASRSAARLLRTLQEGGWSLSPEVEWRWPRARGAGFYAAPTTYQENVKLLVEEIHGRIREALLRDLVSSRDEPTPPEYRDLVDRYFRVLSEEGVGE